MSKRGCVPYTTMIMGFASKGLLERINWVFVFRKGEMEVFCLTRSIKDGRDLFNEMAEKNVVCRNVMLNGYAKVGDFELAQELFEEIPMKKKDVAWTNLISL
ncbi:hypothetical protein V6N12_045761 [Hibiscus sabdariffa]|uniref:Pentatricopeptide repeat-containing protein n=1 Tax=Hibiscus sabdariffa TaxID=183260 RepID=A0ABR2G3M4_9ROSI